MIKRAHNSLSVHGNSWTLKFDNFSLFQNVINDSPVPSNVIMTHYVWKSICDSQQNKNSTKFYAISERKKQTRRRASKLVNTRHSNIFYRPGLNLHSFQCFAVASKQKRQKIVQIAMFHWFVIASEKWRTSFSCVIPINNIEAFFSLLISLQDI